ncbi:response regulator [Labilibaculum sp. DW002]|uniref:histidine kinase n=1 Tax=Paralabilibaculum antarcticum TaxID=2912572 RepID=A0ABT5VQ51_9BACT|nr:response regulator [Labilibaculum sp. DW002]MDE5416623.1 response regulator [Labilibaculum sp. DW002]
MQTNDLIKDISFLYELALSVGRSLDKKENCKQFLHTLMSFKNIEFGCVWIKNYNIPYSNVSSGYKAIYSHPIIKLKTVDIDDSLFLDHCFNDRPSFSCILTKEISEQIGFKVKEGGAVTFFQLQNLGFIMLYSSSEKRIWNDIDLTKLRNVVDKFSISIKACLFHEKSIQDLITITETKKLLEKAKKEAEESEKLKSAFLSNISHEIRTPINAIVGFSNLLSDKDIDAELHKGFIEHISNNSEKLLKLINNLIDVSKMETNQLAVSKNEFVLNPVIMDLFKAYTRNSNIKSDVDLRLKLPPNSENISIFSDKNKIIQILDNLIDNAMKFTANGIIEIGYFIENDIDPVFFIKDTGVGICTEKQHTIFEIFRQGENSSTRKFEGSGIGLTLCQKLVHLLDGEIWFDSKIEVGSNFYFKLHDSIKSNLQLLNHSKDSASSENDSSEVKLIDFSNRRVLIAEDVKSNFKYLNAIIELTDAEVIWAKNGADAIDICKSNDSIDLVLMDIRMPEIGGLDAIKQIKEIDSTIPVVVQTAFALNNEKEECLAAGADDFITKPIDPHKLIEILQKFL